VGDWGDESRWPKARQGVGVATLHRYAVSLDAAMRTLCRKPTAASDLRSHNMLQWTKVLELWEI